MTSQVTEEKGRFRWTVFKDGVQISTGTRKRQTEAEYEAKAEIKFRERMARRDRA